MIDLRDKRTDIEKLDDIELDLVTRQIGENNFGLWEALHVQIMDIQRKRRELRGGIRRSAVYAPCTLSEENRKELLDISTGL